MLDPLILAAIGLAAGAPLALAPVPTALALVAAAWCLVSAPRGASDPRWRPGSRSATAPRCWPVFVAMLLAAISGARARHSLSRAHQVWLSAAAALPVPSRCSAEVIVQRSPIVMRRLPSSTPGSEERARVTVAIVAADCGERSLPVPMWARLYGVSEALGRGDRLVVAADLAPVQLLRNPGLGDPRVRLALDDAVLSGRVAHARVVERGRGLPRWIDAARRAVRRRIDASYAPDLAPFARALVLGEADLGDEDRAAFRRSGLAHLLAVSGMHLVLVVLAFVRALRFVLARIEPLAAAGDVGRAAAGVGAALCWLYADFAGGGGSAQRAAAMLSLALVARTWGRRPSGLRAFACSVVGGAVVQPLAMCDLSFALSVGATAGLLASRRWVRAVQHGRGRLVRWASGALLSTSSAMIGCAPWLALLSAELPLLGVVANVLAAPVGELAALPLCLIHAALWWAPDAEQGAAWVASGALTVVRAVAHETASSSAAVMTVPMPTAEQLAWLAVATILLHCAGSTRWRVGCTVLAVAVLPLLEWAAVHAGVPRAGELRCTFLDVGQGDAALLDLPDRRLMLVDGGGSSTSLGIDPGTRVVLPVLNWRRRSRIDVVVITHPHPDHFGGLLSALPEVDVGEIWTTAQAEVEQPDGALAQLLADQRRRGVPVLGPEQLCHQPRPFGAALVRVLAPCPRYDAAHSPNDNSLVLRVELGERSLLLAGDAEGAEECAVVADRLADLAADLLKVGHHGACTSSTGPFLRAVLPSHAIISSGVRNRFGHPHPRTLAALRRHGATVWRTDRCGAIVWRTDGRRSVVSCVDE